MVERETETEAGAEVREGNAKKEREEVEVAKDLEKGEVGFKEKMIQSSHDDENHNSHEEFQLSRFHRLNPMNPLRIVINSATRVATPSPSQSRPSQPRSTPTPQQVIWFFCYICRETACSIFINFDEITRLC